MLEISKIPNCLDYGITKSGEIYSFKKGVRRKLKPYPDRKGYSYVNIWDKGKVKKGYIHKLVLETYIGQKPHGKYCASHINGNPSDNRLENLRWATNSENQMDRVRHHTSNRGASNGQCKISENVARQIKHLLRKNVPVPEIARFFDTTYGIVRGIKDKKTWVWL